MHKILSLTIVCIISSAIQIPLWLLLFSTQALSGMVFFYRGLVFLLFSVLATAVVLILLHMFASRKNFKNLTELITFDRSAAALALCTSASLSFFIVVPVTIERSVTTFMLGRMESAGAVTPTELRRILSVSFVDDTRAVERRTSEQIASGNIELKADGRFELTPRAKLFLRFSERVAVVFGVRPSYLPGPDESQ